MKITVDVDCTPEEARRFMGLPDMGPIHDLYFDRIKRMMDEGITPDTLEAMMRTWSPMGDTSMAFWRQTFEQIAKVAGGKS